MNGAIGRDKADRENRENPKDLKEETEDVGPNIHVRSSK
jgi:hypothetical protein